MKTPTSIPALLLLALIPASSLAAQNNIAQLEKALRIARNLQEVAKKKKEAGDLDGARSAVEKALDSLERAPGAQDYERIMCARWELANLSGEIGYFEGQKKAWTGVIVFYNTNNADEDPARFPFVQQARVALALAWMTRQEWTQAEKLLDKVTALFRKKKPIPGKFDLSGIYKNLSRCRVMLGKNEASLRAWRESAKLLEGVPEDQKKPEIMQAWWELALVAGQIPDLAAERKAWQGVISYYEGIQAEKDPKALPWLQQARLQLAQALARKGHFVEALPLHDQVIRVSVERLGPDHKQTLIAQAEKAKTLNRKGDLEQALAIQRKVLARFREILPPEDRDLYHAMRDLAATLRDISFGQSREILELRQEALEGYLKILPPEAEDLQIARLEVASSHLNMRNYVPARRLIEQAMAVLEKIRLPHHESRIMARQELGVLLQHQGDLVGARTIQERCLEIQLRSLPPSSPTVLQARDNLAMTLVCMGQLKAARVQFEATLQAYDAAGCADHYMATDVRHSLASTWLEAHEYQKARDIFERVIAAYKKRGDWRLAYGQAELAACLAGLGDLEGANRLFKEAFLTLNKGKTSAHYHNLTFFRRYYALTLTSLRKWDALAGQLDTMLDEGQWLVEESYATCPRGIGETAYLVGHNLDTVLSLLPELPPDRRGDLPARTFALQETLRCAAIRATGAFSRLRMSPEIAALRERSLISRQKLGNLTAELTGRDKPDPRAREKLRRACARRDQADRALRLELMDAGFKPLEIQTRHLAAALGGQDLAVAYRLYSRWQVDEKERHKNRRENRFGAYLLRPDGQLRFLDLGAVPAVRSLVEAWRNEVGKPVPRDLKPIAQPQDDRQERTAGARLRAKVLDPILAASGSAKRLHICLDGALHLVPLEALPAATKENRLVGQDYEILYHTSFDELLRKPVTPTGPTRLVAFGSLDYYASPEREKEARPGPFRRSRGGYHPGPAECPLRGGAFDSIWEPLAETRKEILTIKTLFERFTTGKDSVLVMGREGTKERFLKEAGKANYLHLATHGFFAGEEVAATGEPNRSGDSSRLNRMVLGFSPMTLCGLVFAGANRPAPGRTRSDCILTAEELAGMDLRDCRLAVLSACDTNVGVKRGGQGIQSLQAALHAAGVRRVVTSLWRVDDEVTRSLMHSFYHHLWVEKFPPARALWQAKMDLRGKRIGPARRLIGIRDWAAFILTGDPG